jgi:hypothetical protein
MDENDSANWAIFNSSGLTSLSARTETLFLPSRIIIISSLRLFSAILSSLFYLFSLSFLCFNPSLLWFFSHHRAKYSKRRE